MRRNDVGTKGECFAQELLRASGYDIVDTNIRYRTGEIDIVAYRDGVYHFVEVKTRTNDRFGSPVEGIFYRKYRTIERLAQRYLHDHTSVDAAWQIDCVGVRLTREHSFVSADLIPNIQY